MKLPSTMFPHEPEWPRRGTPCREDMGYELERSQMVARQLAARGITDPRVLAAMGAVPREEFVEPEAAAQAYRDSPLPIAEHQTISQPFVVACMAQAMNIAPGQRVLEIGTGSGYGAAVLSLLAGEVYTVERLETLAETARERFARARYRNIFVRCGDGTLGWPAHAPYSSIAVTASSPTVPKALLGQLAIGGKLLIPVGPTQRAQQLLCITREGEQEYKSKELGGVQFVPLIGAEGWPADGTPGGSGR